MSEPASHPEAIRDHLSRARLCLLFTPELVRGEPLEVLEAVLDHVDLIQIRPKAPGSGGPTSARETYDWTLRVLDLVRARGRGTIPVLANDRVDVARSLLDRGCAGVHLGQDDCPPAVARAVLGPAPLVGLSTHHLRQVVLAGDEPVDYLGFGPIHPTATKGYGRGLGAEMAWIAAEASELPLFPIGGIGPENAAELERVGRAAVSSAILTVADPAAAARTLRALLEP
ncbi:MAG TPA: thiamine phosphate synthase [Planctomycetota bacterium]|nr:thiamine phosphate synthase [Planctomycetota bacterium]